MALLVWVLVRLEDDRDSHMMRLEAETWGLPFLTYTPLRGHLSESMPPMTQYLPVGLPPEATIKSIPSFNPKAIVTNPLMGNTRL